MTATYTFDAFCTLDGFGSYGPDGDWGGYWGKHGPELLARRRSEYDGEQRMVLGADTFREFVEMIGPSVDVSGDEWIMRMREMPATVVSSTLVEPLDWPDVTIVRGDAVDVVTRLKTDSDVPLRSHGSLSLNRALMAAGLVDVVQVTIFPVVSGRTGSDPIFRGAADFDLELIETRTLDGRTQELPLPAHAPLTRAPQPEERLMGNIVLDMSMSLDGFIAGPGDGPAAGLGENGDRLHSWLAQGDGVDPNTYRPDGPSAVVFDEMLATGAVLVGRRTFDIAGHWDGDHHDGVPIFVPTHHPPADPPTGRATITYVTDGIESAVAQAKAAAGDRNVMFHGADTAQRALRAGVLDELALHLVPVLLGEGRRLFEHLGADHTVLELTRIIDAPGVTHLNYRVLH